MSSDKTSYQFTQDWFSWAPPVWEKLIPMLPGRMSFLEIGSFEGRSTVWIAENMAEPEAHIHCIDTWEGGEEHSAEDMRAVELRFDYNVRKLRTNNDLSVYKHKGFSTYVLAEMLAENVGFDFIYVDGSHTAKDVLTDACMAWPMLRNGGFMVFDDYLWGNPRDALHRPKMAIDAFINLFAEQIEVAHVGYQLIVRKKS